MYHPGGAQMTTEPTLAAIIADLAHPFPIAEIQVRPGAVAGDGTRALALPYADWRLYAERLDAVTGAANWGIQLIPWGTNAHDRALDHPGCHQGCQWRGRSE
jgi:hypothetical protein